MTIDEALTIIKRCHGNSRPSDHRTLRATLEALVESGRLEGKAVPTLGALQKLYTDCSKGTEVPDIVIPEGYYDQKP